MSKRLFPVVGGQFGSEAKGHVAAQLARRELDEGQKVWAVRVAGHNAGHTAYDAKGQSFALRTIPCMAVVDPDVQCFIAAGSELAIDVLESEVSMLEAGGHEIRDRLFISPQATLIEPRHIEAETDQTMHERLGSTGKGVGSARADRLMRKATLWGDTEYAEHYNDIWDPFAFDLTNVPPKTSIILEGTQGYGLGLHAGHYPYCTSSDTRAIDFLAMAGIDPVVWSHVGVYEPIVVFRSFPIRVAGNSGDLYDETDWETLEQESGGHIKPERTTVTKKIRRVGRWDSKLMRDACQANGGRGVASAALTFADYLDPSIANSTDLNEVLSSEPVAKLIREINQHADVTIITTGPATAVWL